MGTVTLLMVCCTACHAVAHDDDCALFTHAPGCEDARPAPDALDGAEEVG